MRSAPLYIREELQRYDPYLRIRWSYQRKKWAVDRKAQGRSQIFLPIKYTPWGYKKLPEHSDISICYRNQTINIFYTPHLDRRLFLALFEMDSFRWGKRFVSKLEESEKKEQKRIDKYDSGELDALSGDVYDHLAYKEGRRASMAS